MIVRLAIELTIDTALLHSLDLEQLKAAALQAGFPDTEENVAWMLAEQVANEATAQGVTAEVVL